MKTVSAKNPKITETSQFKGNNKDDDSHSQGIKMKQKKELSIKALKV